ncbi:MAG: DUF2062 domain-containing protein [gamma proteobacterium symbiont of Bathyaustriella thionipta]|nr:DUF2062 domain-containing protein [gamma proteobacterium symbiont of Bathyaustriella thionipta]MCU7951443.1 DUF2062 domain-containing protein [gamma proteobacterium symbiont of Bathyaustriella thionipta]MCU7954746.1 DUF2062 domain-containing protein [gamma proteobacterium symbiont of Bathyaustriella thionipta]MCU7958010.1 DUF2062 domain-containing protein [gamma proteobacterium symbiont of Bathyaustriella thionipta]MCU7968757.1 DUF2062 domain-containing protein [gamma proteobacterium symbion
MPKRIIKKYMPDHKTIKDHKHLQMFGTLLHDGNLWHFNRRSVSGAFAVGIFCAFIPLPLQMVFAAAIAILVRVNLPISVSLVWITNPVTMPPIFYLSYNVGAFVMGQEAISSDYKLTADWFTEQIDLIWQPFLLGCFISGMIAALIAYTLIRLLWRLHIVRHIQERKARIRQQKQAKK